MAAALHAHSPTATHSPAGQFQASFSVTQATHADAEGIAKVVNATFHVGVAAYLTPDQVETDIKSHAVTWFIVTLKTTGATREVFAAIAYSADSNGNTCALRMLATAQTYDPMALGSLLLHAAEQRAMAEKKTKITLEVVTEDQTMAKTLGDKLQFKQVTAAGSFNIGGSAPKSSSDKTSPNSARRKLMCLMMEKVLTTGQPVVSAASEAVTAAAKA